MAFYGFGKLKLYKILYLSTIYYYFHFMNLVKSTRSIFLICCLLFIAGIQPSFKWKANVLAQENITPKESVQELSAQEKIDLEQGNVVLKGQKGNYLGRVLAQGDVDTAWEVLTDYDNFDRFLPNIAASKIIAEEGDRIIFEQINVVDLWLFKQEFKVQIEAIKNKPTQVNFKIVDGDLKKLIGRWEIRETSSGKILVSHGVEVEPGSDTEKPFFYGVYESTLEDTLAAISQEISKRSL